MAEREDTSFKVTDRRKFNPDGTPRETDPGSPAPVAQENATATTREAATGNVVSFPGDTTQPLEQDRASRERENAVDEKAAGAASAKAAASEAERAYARSRGATAAEPPDASFLSLVNMLGVEAAMHLGLLRNPGEEPPPIDLETARQLIDTLAMLQRKTRGNLTSEEDSLLESILADLRMRFVELSRGR